MDHYLSEYDQNIEYEYKTNEEIIDEREFPDLLEIRVNKEKFLCLSNDVIKRSRLVRMLVRNKQLGSYIEIPFISEKWISNLSQTRDFIQDILNGKKYNDIFQKKNPNYNIFMILKCLENYLMLDNYIFEKFENNWKYKMFITQIEKNKDFSDFFSKKNNKNNKKNKK